MEIFQPDLGLFFWTVLAFGIFLFIMKKYVWKSLIDVLNERDRTIAESLSMAEKAREEYSKLQQEQQKLVKETQDERLKILKLANEERTRILAEAQQEALKISQRLIEEARKEISQEKEAAINELKKAIATYSVEIAEMILRQKLENEKVQQSLIDQYLNEIKLN